MPTKVWLQKVQSRILPTVIRSIVTGGTAVTKPVTVLPETEIGVNSVMPLVAPAMEQVRQLLRSW